MARVRAPELVGVGGWIGVPEPLSLARLAGRVVVLHFWTQGCVSCHRVLDDVAEVQRRWPDDVVVVGVHSPKFPHESRHGSLQRAVARLGIGHPVLDDPEMVTWQQYGVRGWPTLVVIDQNGDVVGAIAGEGNRPLLLQAVEDTIGRQGRYRSRRRPLDLQPPRQPPGSLAYPVKVASDRRNRLAVSDTGHNRVLVVELAAGSPPRGRITHIVGGLRQPQGVRLYGAELFICDAGHDRLVRIDLAARPGPDEVVEPDSAGIVRLRVRPDDILAPDLASPWDVIADLDRSLVVAEAGRHRLWRVPPDGSAPGVLAGSRYQGLLDGRGNEAELAQPSGLTRLPEGVVFVDAESSSLRILADDGRVGTMIGRGLYDWGRRDGGRRRGRLQHPQGVAASLDADVVYVADTYNSRLCAWQRRGLRTVRLQRATPEQGGLLEPGGLDVLPDGQLVVADTGNCRIVVVDPLSGRLEPLTLEATHVPALPAPVAEGAPLLAEPGQPFPLPFEVDLGPYDLDASADGPVRIVVDAQPGWLLDHGPRVWRHGDTHGRLVLQGGSVGEGWLVVTVTAAARGDGVTTVRQSRTRHVLAVR
jgi:thiol-disulfide isomerase/thioredoxin